MITRMTLAMGALLLAACGGDDDGGGTAECGAVPLDGCEVCDGEFGAAHECPAGATIYACQDGEWASAGTCQYEVLVVDGAWSLQQQGDLVLLGCPDITLPELAITADNPEGAQTLTLSAASGTFSEETLLLMFETANAEFHLADTWDGATVEADYDLDLDYTGAITGIAQAVIELGEEQCFVELTVTGTFTPGSTTL